MLIKSAEKSALNHLYIMYSPRKCYTVICILNAFL